MSTEEKVTTESMASTPKSVQTSTRTNFKDMLISGLANMTKHITRNRKRDESLAKCLFTSKDVVDTLNPLARFFRMMCVDDNISKEMFFDMHKAHLEQLGLTPNLINIDKHNLIKALVKPSITMDVLSKTTEILGYRVLDMTYTVLDTHTGEVKTYSINHIPNDIDTNPESTYSISNK